MGLRYICILLVLLLSVTFPGAAAGEKIVRLVADPWCPYNCGKDDAIKGIFVEVSEAAFGAVGYQVDYQTMPWRRALAMGKMGHADVVLGVDTDHGIPLHLNKNFSVLDEIVAVSLQSNPIELSKVPDLKKYRVGSIAEYIYDDTGEINAIIDADPKNIKVYSVPGVVRLLNLLAGNRVDVILENRYVVEYSLAKHGEEETLRITSFDLVFPIYFGFTRSAKGLHLSQKFDEGLAIIRASGQLEALFQKYNMAMPN